MKEREAASGPIKTSEKECACERALVFMYVRARICVFVYLYRALAEKQAIKDCRCGSGFSYFLRFSQFALYALSILAMTAETTTTTAATATTAIATIEMICIAYCV